MAARHATIDEYIAEHPPAVRKILQKVRATIRAVAREAEEAIKYGMPTFVLNGNLVHFAAYEEHISVYPAPRGAGKLDDEVAPYVAGKGTLRFPLDEPIPYALIRKVVEHRVRQRRR